MICPQCEFLWGNKSARRDGCSCEEEEEWSEEFDQDEMSAEVEAENGYGEEE
jgi:hypothetical protein